MFISVAAFLEFHLRYIQIHKICPSFFEIFLLSVTVSLETYKLYFAYKLHFTYRITYNKNKVNQ